MAEEPEYSRLAARLLATYKEVRWHGVHSFSQSIALAHQEGLIGDATAAFVATHARKLDDAVDHDTSRRFEYFGLRTVYDRYLLRHPAKRTSLERPPPICPAHLLDSPRDELDSIYERYHQIARLSKFAGGIGVQ